MIDVICAAILRAPFFPAFRQEPGLSSRAGKIAYKIIPIDNQKRKLQNLKELLGNKYKAASSWAKMPILIT